MRDNHVETELAPSFDEFFLILVLLAYKSHTISDNILSHITEMIPSPFLYFSHTLGWPTSTISAWYDIWTVSYLSDTFQPTYLPTDMPWLKATTFWGQIQAFHIHWSSWFIAVIFAFHIIAKITKPRQYCHNCIGCWSCFIWTFD